MARPRTSDGHLQQNLYVKRGKRSDTYYTIINAKYVGLGSERAEAERKLRQLKGQAADDNTIASMCELYIAELKRQYEAKDKTALAIGTITDYENSLTKYVLPIFGLMKPTDFRPMHKAQYLAKMREKERAVRANREMAALGSAFNHGMTLGLVDSNPCHGVKRNKETPRTRLPKISEVNQLLTIAKAKGTSSYMIALIGVMVALTGRRRAEILNMHMSDLSDEGILTFDAKTKAGEASRSYMVQWSPFLRELLTEARGLPRTVGSMYVFANREGQPYSDSGFKAMWNRIMNDFVKAGGERFTAHDLRALYVSEKAQRGEKAETHKSEETTRRVYERNRVVKVKPLA
jgi:integrase